MTRKILALVLTLGFATSIYAADDIRYFSIEEAIKEAKTQGIIDDSIQFKFGSGSGNKDKIFIKNLSTNKKSNKVGKDAKASCQRAFHSAILHFFTRAKREGATKVVNLTGYFKKIPYDSKTEFQCGVGNLMSGVTLRGDLAK